METCPLISIVLPAYNEELNIRPLFERLHPILEQLSDRFRFEFVVTELRIPAIHPYRLHEVPRGRSDPT
jgi:hypothetical protein